MPFKWRKHIHWSFFRVILNLTIIIPLDRGKRTYGIKMILWKSYERFMYVQFASRVEGNFFHVHLLFFCSTCIPPLVDSPGSDSVSSYQTTPYQWVCQYLSLSITKHDYHAKNKWVYFRNFFCSLPRLGVGLPKYFALKWENVTLDFYDDQ